MKYRRIRNCPICGRKARYKGASHFASCADWECPGYSAWIPLSVWNDIRIGTVSW